MLIEIIILLLGVPTGYLIAWLARDELISGRKWFRLLIALSLLSGIIFYFAELNYIALTNVFMAIIGLVSLIKSKDKKWTKFNNKKV